MPRDWIGQKISFSVEVASDEKYAKYRWVHVTKAHNTCLKIAARYGHTELAREIADLNGIHYVRSPLQRPRIRIPGILRPRNVVHVHAGAQAPRPTNGYAKFDVLDRPGRTGLTHFLGYDPFTLEVPIQFEGLADQTGPFIETQISELEAMAGRGQDATGAGSQPPPVIRVEVTDNSGNTVPLISTQFQATRQNPSAPLWRIANIEWDADALRDKQGYRIRQAGTVTLQQHVKVAVAQRSAAKRSRDRHPKGK